MHSARKNKVSILLTLVCAALTAGRLSAALTEMGGLDLVVLVDQSGSMSGQGSDVKNDPYNVRNLMVTFTLDLMAKNAVLNQVSHRLGVISFGSRVEVDLPLSEVSADRLDALRAKVEAMRTRASLGNTDFLGAFQEAARMFAGLPSHAERQRALVLITDGAPYVDDMQLSAYTKALRSFAAEHFPPSEYQIRVVALNDPQSDYWDRYRNLWRDISDNQAKKLEGDENDIFAALLGVVTGLVRTRVEPVIEETTLVKESIVIPPYLESTVFDVFSVDPAVEINIFSPDDSQDPLGPDSEGVDAVMIGEIIRTLTIHRPQPGLWTVKKSDPQARVIVFNEQFFPRGELLEPDGELRRFESAAVVYRVIDGDGQPIRELAGYPLRLELSLVRPDGERTRVAMMPAPELGEAAFRTVDEVTCDQPGRYRTEVLVATKDLNDQPVTVFQDGWSGFVVRDARRLEGRLASPVDGSELPLFGQVLFWPRPLAVRVAFVDETEQPVNLAALVKGSPSELLKFSVERDGHAPDAPFELHDIGGGILEGRLRGPSRPGRYRLRLDADRSLVPEQYGLRLTPREVTFSRHLTASHWAQLGLLAAAVFAVVSAAGQRAWLNWRAPLRGTLYIDRLGTGQVKEFALDRRRHRMTLKELPLETQLAKLVVRARRGRAGGVIVTAVNVKKETLLKERTLPDRGQTMLKGIPYILKYRA